MEDRERGRATDRQREGGRDGGRERQRDSHRDRERHAGFFSNFFFGKKPAALSTGTGTHSDKASKSAGNVCSPR